MAPQLTARRLGRLAAHLHPSAAPVAQQSEGQLSNAEDVVQSLLPLPLLDSSLAQDSGWMQPDTASVHEAMAAAAAAGDFRLAALLKDLAFTADPKPPLSIADCAPDGPAAAAEFFIRNGFVVVPQLFEPEHMARIQGAWSRAQAPARALWEESKSLGHGARGLSFENQAELSAKFANLPHGRLYCKCTSPANFTSHGLPFQPKQHKMQLFCV